MALWYEQIWSSKVCRPHKDEWISFLNHPQENFFGQKKIIAKHAVGNLGVPS